MAERILLKKLTDDKFEDHCKLLVSNNVYDSFDEAKKKERDWFEKAVGEYDENKPEFYSMGVFNDGELIGNVIAEKMDFENKKCEIGFWIGKDYQRKGYATEAVKTFLDSLDKKFGFSRFEACHYSDNYAPSGVLKKIGFRADGLEKQVYKKEGVWIDKVFYVKN